MTKKVVILTAGEGSRLNSRTKYFNKCLLRVGNQAAISHQINYFPADTEFVIALGYKGDIVKQYLQIAHPNTNFTFVNIDKYSIIGTGPAYALYNSQKHLQEPFFLLACDTLIQGTSNFVSSLPWQRQTSFDWIGISRLPRGETPDKFCMVSMNGNVVDHFEDKQMSGLKYAFIGAAHISDYKTFWQAMERNNVQIEGELQLSTALSELSPLQCIEMKWLDIGTEDGLQRARKQFKGLQNLDKEDEELYLVDGHVVKYFHNSNIAKNRIARAAILREAVPNIVKGSDNFYKYGFVDGEDLFSYEKPDEIMPALLQFAKTELWKPVALNGFEKSLFRDTCDAFYSDKTLQRLEKYYQKVGYEDARCFINGEKTEQASTYLADINWKALCDGVPSNFHGDFVFSNIVITPGKEFQLIDWRQDFGGLIEYGDMYYDLAKLNTCLIMPHTSIKNGNYVFENLSESEYRISIDIPERIEKCRTFLHKWVSDNGYSQYKVNILTALILLNMAPLHEAPLDQWLYFYALNTFRILGEMNQYG